MTQAARKAHGPTPLAEFNWEDPLDLESQLSEDERMIRDTARAFCADMLQRRVLKALKHVDQRPPAPPEGEETVM